MKQCLLQEFKMINKTLLYRWFSRGPASGLFTQFANADICWLLGGVCGAYGGGERWAQCVGGKARGKEAIGETQT
jgi:hypothetical protein